MGRGKGVGFFEAGNFHPDFIWWLLKGAQQYVTFIEPHGLLHEGPASEKILFHRRIKDVEKRLNDPGVILNSFILSWTIYPQLKWGIPTGEMEKMNVLFMTDDRDGCFDILFDKLGVKWLHIFLKPNNEQRRIFLEKISRYLPGQGEAQWKNWLPLIRSGRERKFGSYTGLSGAGIGDDNGYENFRVD